VYPAPQLKTWGNHLSGADGVKMLRVELLGPVRAWWGDR
jgi:hypothetical protein